MIDFIKFEINEPLSKNLEDNYLLDFVYFLNRKTGELSSYAYADYKGLKFKLYESTTKTQYKRITIEGSLHKYYNNGIHNYNDFNRNQFNWVIEDLIQKFKINPSNCILKQIEIGVNIEPPKQTREILNCCLLHKTTPFKWISVKDEGEYIQASHQRHYIKVYNKRKHYEKKGHIIEKDILRFEIKYSRMHYLKSIGIRTLKDVINCNFKAYKPILTKEWNNILFADRTCLKDHKNEYKYNNQTFWNELNPNKLKYHRNKLEKLLNQDQNNDKFEIERRIKNKIEELENPPKSKNLPN